MRMITSVAASVAFALSATSFLTHANDMNLSVITQSDHGKPSFVRVNSQQQLKATDMVKTLKNIINQETSFKATGNEHFVVKRQWVDKLGIEHTKMVQTINGLTVYGTDMTVHAFDKSVYAVSGKLAVSAKQVDVKAFALSNKHILQAAKKLGKAISTPELAYVFLPLTGETRLVYKVEVTYNINGDFGHDSMFFDAKTAELVNRHAHVHTAKSWKTYDHQNQSYTATPTRLLCTDNQSCGDASADRAHAGASSVYDFYKNRFGRNGINGSDMTTISSVHVETNLNNAFWYNNQMLYGDGDGSQFYDLTLAHDVIGHELTHGVTQYSANLIYQNASGALNEAWSDILGVAAESYKLGNTQPDWKLGEEVMVSGGALRYMNNPTADNYSRDWYPDRIPFVSNPNNSNDQGGVHGNSGIANLAFQLVVDGGSHPRSKSTVVVPSIGLAKAEQIFYRALTTYMGQSTDFLGARTATAQSAIDLYGANEKAAIEAAWCAVGVDDGTCSGGSGGNVLINGSPVTGLTASTGNEVIYTFDVPAGATNITIASSGGSGDADMYVKFGAMATDSNYDCRPYKGGNNESCTLTDTGGVYYVRLKAYQSFSGVTLIGSYDGGSSGPTPIDSTTNNISVGTGSWQNYTLDLASGYSSLVISTTGGSGDIDMYTRFGSQATSSSYDCRPYKSGNSETCTHNNPQAGTWHINLYGYSSASGVSLNVKAD